MNEKEWMKEVRQKVESEEICKELKLSICDGKRIPYSFEIISYKDDKPEETNIIKYETDLFICQNLSENIWKPRIIIEGKLNSATILNTITYRQKTATHKSIFKLWRIVM